MDLTSGYKVYNFIDVAQGYHQIQMYKFDEKKTSFVTNISTFCYTVMPFGLKNARATYYRLVNTMFKDQIGKIMVYVDDMTIKSTMIDDHARDLKEAFNILEIYHLKLNPEKCAFSVKAGKFLGFMISQRGIEANLEKIKVIMEMKPPSSINEVQKLNGQIIALGRFIPCSIRRCLRSLKP